MNLRSKIHLEAQKAAAERDLAARLAILEQRGLDAKAIQRDASVRKGKAAVRKAGVRLATIAAKERRNEERSRAKAEKAAAATRAVDPAPAEPPAEPPAERPKRKSKKAQ